MNEHKYFSVSFGTIFEICVLHRQCRVLLGDIFSNSIQWDLQDSQWQFRGTSFWLDLTEQHRSGRILSYGVDKCLLKVENDNYIGWKIMDRPFHDKFKLSIAVVYSYNTRRI